MTTHSAFYTVRELASYLRLDVDKVYRMANRKQLPAFQCGRSWRFPKSSIEDWIAKGGNTKK